MIYFASDFHLGMGINADERERKICRWLDFVSEDASDIFLLGDLFDFWFEYKKAVPKGFVRFLGKLAELTDKGIRIHVCVGNHDLWMRDYLEKECGVRIFREPEVHEFSGRTFVLHHGDGLGPGDEKYKLLKRIFTNKLAQGFFGMLHPDLGIRLASGWSKKSRLNQPKWEETFQGNDKEYLVQFCEDWSLVHGRGTLVHGRGSLVDGRGSLVGGSGNVVDYFVFGHRHLLLDVTLSNGVSRYINLGQWFTGSAYAKFDGDELVVHEFEKIK